MVRREDADLQQQQAWHRRVERGRKELSASVEDVLADGASYDELEELEEEEEQADGQECDEGPGLVVAPRLSLQSRELTALPSQRLMPTAPGESDHEQAGRLAESEGATEAEKQRTNRVLIQFARRLTSSLAALGMARQPVARPGVSTTAPPPPATSGQPSAAPAERGESSEEGGSSTSEPSMTRRTIIAVPRDGATGAAPVTSPAPVREAPSRSPQRLAGRTTRVRLEAAPRAAPQPPRTTAVIPEPQPRGAQVSAGPAAAVPAQSTAGQQRWQVGKGLFARGQGEVAIGCPQISEGSLVLVTLLGDPGPVVVHYVSLQPGRGFTIHLSAPPQRETPFHYAVLEN
jgi:hypothetical protein